MSASSSPAKQSRFHPKMYLFTGPKKCRFFIGSHNLTVGGMETNWEAGVKLDLLLPEDQSTYDEMHTVWSSLVPLTLEVTDINFPSFVASGLLLDESKLPARSKATEIRSGAGGTDAIKSLNFPKVIMKPPSALPVSTFVVKRARAQKVLAPARALPKPKPAIRPAAEALVIQIVPHHNGEVFLSKIAINQNPNFFGFPWTGRTVPKKAGNRPYQQRVPDPVVNLTVYDNTGKPGVLLKKLSLNTVFYEEKTEIRITVPPVVVKNTPHYSI